MSQDKKVVWIKPSGAEIRLNEEKATIEQAIANGWVPNAAAKKKEYGIAEPMPDSSKDEKSAD